MDLLLQLADSEVAAVEALDGGLRLRFSAATVWRDAGAAPATPGHLRGVRLELRTAPGSALPPLADCIGRLAQGRVGRAGQWLGRLPLPVTLEGPLELDLSFAGCGSLRLHATSLHCVVEGEPDFHESLAC